MKTAVVTIRREPYYRRAAIEKGLQRLGYTIVESATRPARIEDCLVLWNLKKGADEAAAKLWEHRGGTVLVLENGYLQRVDKTYYAISVHGHNGSGWFPVGPEDRFSKLGFTLKPWQHNPTGEHLVRGQRGIGSARMASPPQWGEKMLAELRGRGLRARLIPHPGNFAPKVHPAIDLKGSCVLHIWASAMGVFALVEGIPVKHHAPHWICAGAGEDNREAMLNRAAHGQWHHEEIATGEPFARIFDHLKECPTWR